MKNKSGKIIERRRHFGGVAWVSDPPKLTSRGRNWAKRSAMESSEAAFPRRPHSFLPPADAAAQAERNRRPHIKYKKSPLLRCCSSDFPGVVDHTGGKRPPRTKHLDEAPVWHTSLGSYSGGSGHAGGANTKTGPCAAMSVRPQLNSRNNWSPGRQKRQRVRNARG